MNRVVTIAAACAAACAAMPAQAVFLSFTVNATGTRQDFAFQPASSPTPSGGMCFVGSDPVLCVVNSATARTFDFAQEFTLTGAVTPYEEGDVATTGRTRFTINRVGDLYSISGFNYYYDNRPNVSSAGTTIALIGLVSRVDVGGVPEPATWAMLIAGFGMVGGAMRVRRRARVAFG